MVSSVKINRSNVSKKSPARSSVMRSSPVNPDGFKTEVARNGTVYKLYKLKKYPDTLKEAQETINNEIRYAQISIFLSFDVDAFKAAVILPNETKTKYGIYIPKKLYDKAFKRV